MRPSMLAPLFLLLLLPTANVAAKVVDLNLETDKTGWVDLLDPLAGELRTNGGVRIDEEQRCARDETIQTYRQKIEELIAANDLLKNQKSDTVDVLLKHILRQFLSRLDVDLSSNAPVDKSARVRLSPADLHSIREYLNSPKQMEEVALREKIRAAMEDFISVEASEEEPVGLLTLRKYLPYLAILNIIVLPPACYHLLRRTIGLRQILGVFLVATFCMSYYFAYIRKYQEVLADRFSRIDHSNDACSPKGLISEAFGVLLSYVRIKRKDQCLQKYEDMLIEPLYLVDPLHVFGEVVTNFIMSPFSVIGIQLNKFFNDFFIDTPIFLVAVKLVFLLLVLFYLSGYRIRTLVATIEPTVALYQRSQAQVSFTPPGHQAIVMTERSAIVYGGAPGQTLPAQEALTMGGRPVIEEIEDSKGVTRETSYAVRRAIVDDRQGSKYVEDQYHQRLEDRNQHTTVERTQHQTTVESYHDPSSSDFPPIVHLDDSNVTRRRTPRKVQRSRSLPRNALGY